MVRQHRATERHHPAPTFSAAAKDVGKGKNRCCPMKVISYAGMCHGIADLLNWAKHIICCPAH